ncbi:cysteinyl-tRNA synthetase [Natranaerovirga pectinivora]|uniref:Cysteine--tRNA ligase n=1 Tax=Natranaerovirga pectinivora TaxID=682400 RepID=A0A4R3MSE8_9FIRM|nr:cysteine--tRNA ligase [Natranaerovirga pectinivora]TCT15727.1 cysteinyl-tRNA synthetase [Natranaerovirga pectinivora]
MKIYNTLTRKKEEFIPIEEGKVKMYVCGPTVYNYIHIGNARPYIVFDTVRRYLEYKGYEVNYVQNFTDIDDKIIVKANEEKVTSKEIAERFIEEALKDADGLNVKRATTHPKATEEIDDMVKMIGELIEKGFAYEKKGTVYFRTQKFDNYGKLSKKNIEDLEAGARIAVNEEKEHPMDFVLWKPKKEGEPAWDAPWSEGRPGWHIECSVMAKNYLGDQIDIHAGGEDLVFPHHENEIAQSEAANGKNFAKYWMHNAFLNIDNKKMSKSTGNFFTVREISEEFSYNVLRFFMLNAHYRNPLNFSRELMEASENGLERIKTAVFNLNHIKDHSTVESITEVEKEQQNQLKSYIDKFEEAMDDDFNTADGIAAIFELVKFANSTVSDKTSKELAMTILETIKKLSDVLGLNFDQQQGLLDEEIDDLILQRQEARKNKDFATADRIRDELMNMGIAIEDTREGMRWKRV